jgi:hypothetical protein
VHLECRLADMREQAPQRAGAAHAVPLVAQAPGGERERVARFTRLGHGLVHGVDEAGAAIGGREDVVFVQAGLALGVAFFERPLLWRLLQ